MYSTYNEWKFVVAERFIRTLKNKIFKHMTAISKNVYFDVLDDIVDKYNLTVHGTIKMKPTDDTDDSYAVYNENSNKKYPKFKVGYHVRISKYKNISAKGFLGLMLLMTWMVKKLLEVFMKKSCKKLVKNKKST